MIREATDNSASLQQDVSRLWSHLVDLGALQCRLFAVEFRRSSASLQRALLLTIAGGVLLTAAAPLLLIAAALQLQTMAGLSLPLSLVIVAVAALLLMWPTLLVAHRIARASVKELISPIRDLEINLRSLAGDAPRPDSHSYSSDSYSSNSYSHGAE